MLSRAYAEYNAIRHFWRRLGSAAAGDSRSVVLEQLGWLYAFSCLDKHLVYFYQGKYTDDANFSQLIKDGVLDVCATLKPNVVALVDAMAPPDFVLNSVLGRSDGRVSCT